MIPLLLASFLLGGAGALLIGYSGGKIGLIDTPNHRSSHTIPTPKGGGIGILAAFIVVSMATHQPLSITLPAILVSLIGLFGDRMELPAHFRLILQFSAAAVTLVWLSAGMSMEPHLTLLLPLWAIFIVGTANFYNFMDGINGIAGITGGVAFGLMAFFAHLDGYQTSAIPVMLALALSCLGFLPFNVPKARVFMGDVSSILLGYIFGVMVFLICDTPLDFLCYGSLLYPFFMDELSTMVIRLSRGENLARAHRSHLYQLLANEHGLDHWKVSAGYGVLQLFVGAGVFGIRPKGLFPVILFLFFCSSLFLVVSFHFRRRYSNEI